MASKKSKLTSGKIKPLLVSQREKLELQKEEKLQEELKKGQKQSREKSKKKRIDVIKEKIKGMTDPELMMIEIMDVLKEEIEIVPPTVGKYYTFIYNAKTPGEKYDQHPLIAALEIKSWGFRGLNYHWEDWNKGKVVRNYTWNEVAGMFLYVVHEDEVAEFRKIPYAKFLTK